jgi:hypothetical protein
MVRTRKALDAAVKAARQHQMTARAVRRRTRDGQSDEERRWTASKRELNSAQEEHRKAIAEWLGPEEARDFERLSADYPILLLPARLETRFVLDEGVPKLRVRIYPDEITANTHEPELTQDEQAAGRQYWQDGWDPAKELAAWQAILGKMSPQRAAWVVRATTPTNLAERPGNAPAFSAVPLKDASWTRAAHAMQLPDRWIVLGYRGRVEVCRAVSNPVVVPLALTLGPDTDGDAAAVVDISGDGLEVDRDVLWTVNFKEAERVGMAVTIEIREDDVKEGFERVYAIGVQGSMSPDEAAQRIEQLIDNHHYGRGLAFVPQGTPTNNLSGQPSGYPPPDSDGSRSHRIERGAAQAGPGTDAARLSAALGISSSVFAHVASADRTEQRHASAMNTLLWPVTWSYFFEQMMPGGISPPTLRGLRDCFVEAVHGRGSLPLFRIGSTPYGVLTVSSIKRWDSSGDEDPVDRGLPNILRGILPIWVNALPQVPRAGRTGDPDVDLVELLEMDASAREVWIRTLMGSDFARNLGVFLDVSLDGAKAMRDDLRVRLDQAFGVEASRSPLIESLFERNAKMFRGGLVADVPVSEEATLDFNYLAWIKPPTSVEDVRQERFPAGVTQPGSLLYRLVRQAILLVYRSAAIELGIKANLATPDDRMERELIGVVDGSEGRKTAWQHLERAIPNVSGTAPLGEYLAQAALQQRASESGRMPIGRRPIVRVTPEVLPLTDYVKALETLQQVPTAELERLTGETLDCCSHRLDAWVSALATRRLERMRADQPAGLHIGGFGWVENLRANRAARLRRTDRDELPTQIGSGGYIHAPALDHAAASAVLRNAYLTRSGAARTPYALDLSSSRVRLARWLLASVREGQPLTALAGYRFERALHERRLDRFIEPLRLKFPLPVAAEAVGPSPQESISPRDVVNGLELRRAWQGGSLDLASLTAPPPNDVERRGLSEELTALDATLDAVADMLTADSVYQLVRGAQSRAGASLDAVAGDARPPEGEFGVTPRGGTALTHRAALILGGDAPAAPDWDGVPMSPRSNAEPRLDAWLGVHLGNPANIRARVIVPVPTIAAPDHVNEVTLSLDTIGLRPIDLVALIPSSGAQTQDAVMPHGDNRTARGAELERRLANAALGGTPQRGIIKLDLGRDPAWGPDIRSFAEALEMARALKAFVGGSRALRAADLIAPENAGEAASADLMTVEADARAAAAVGALGARIAALELAVAAIPSVAPGDPEPDLEPLREQLKAASSFGLAQSYPALPNRVYDDAHALLEARIAAVTASSPTSDLEPLKEALRRAERLGIAVEPQQVAKAGSRADAVATLAVARVVSQGVAARAALEAQHARQSLLTLAQSVRDALASRHTAANAATNAADKMKSVFGPDFVWVPRFQPVRTAELQAALQQGPQLGASERDKHRWLAQAAQVRAPLRRWRRVALYAGATGAALPQFDLAQVPHVDPARWVALPFASEAERPPAGRVSLALFRASKPAADDPWCGLVIDEWPEIIPASAETTGLAFHYDDPGAEAPQCVLLAVPPARASQWDLASLVAILDDALMLAKVRAIHSEQLSQVGQLLPAIYLAANPLGDTVSTDFSKLKSLTAQIVKAEQ